MYLFFFFFFVELNLEQMHAHTLLKQKLGTEPDFTVMHRLIHASNHGPCIWMEC